MSNRYQDMKLLHKAFLAKDNTKSNLKLCWLICDCTCDDIPKTIDGSLNQGSSDRFFNREIRVVLTDPCLLVYPVMHKILHSL